MEKIARESYPQVELLKQDLTRKLSLLVLSLLVLRQDNNVPFSPK
jgi:hypothetical protein